WQMYGYIVFAVTCVAYETFHAVFVANEVIAQAKLRQKLLNLTNGSMDRKELETFNYLYYLILIGIAIDWTAGTI
ncbi:hypothetical protein HK103_001816, partial [Boothiomyces macroporosus]